MHAFRHAGLTTELTFAALVDRIGVAVADDGGAESFVGEVGAGSARGATAPGVPARTPAARTEGPRPDADVTRIGVAQAASDLHIAVTRMGHGAVVTTANSAHVDIARRAARAQLPTADRAPPTRGGRHAMQRDADRAVVAPDASCLPGHGAPLP